MSGKPGRSGKWKRPSALARFVERFVIDDSGCWTWMGWISESGYGMVSYKGRDIPAHVLAYLLYKGDLPEGTEIDHLCRNRACVNPDHLEAVTHKVNQQRMGTERRKQITHCKHGHEFRSENTIWKSNGTRYCRICSNLSHHESQRRYRAKLKAFGVRRKDRDVPGLKLSVI